MYVKIENRNSDDSIPHNSFWILSDIKENPGLSGLGRPGSVTKLRFCC